VRRLHEEIEQFAQRATPTAKERLAMEAAVEVRVCAGRPERRELPRKLSCAAAPVCTQRCRQTECMPLSFRVRARNVC